MVIPPGDRKQRGKTNRHIRLALVIPSPTDGSARFVERAELGTTRKERLSGRELCRKGPVDICFESPTTNLAFAVEHADIAPAQGDSFHGREIVRCGPLLGVRHFAPAVKRASFVERAVRVFATNKRDGGRKIARHSGLAFLVSPPAPNAPFEFERAAMRIADAYGDGGSKVFRHIRRASPVISPARDAPFDIEGAGMRFTGGESCRGEEIL